MRYRERKGITRGEIEGDKGKRVSREEIEVD